MSEPRWLTRAMLEAMHADLLTEHGGHPGLRDEGALESALARPRQRLAYDAGADLVVLAASCGFSLAHNHPFVDGNKRVAFMAMYVFLASNGLEIRAPEPAVVDAMRRLADGSLDGEKLSGWLREVVVRRG